MYSVCIYQGRCYGVEESFFLIRQLRTIYWQFIRLMTIVSANRNIKLRINLIILILVRQCPCLFSVAPDGAGSGGKLTEVCWSHTALSSDSCCSLRRALRGWGWRGKCGKRGKRGKLGNRGNRGNRGKAGILGKLGIFGIFCDRQRAPYPYEHMILAWITVL